MSKLWFLSASIVAVLLSAAGARAQEKVNLVLNWVPTADHSPYFFAKQQGWYKQAGIDLNIEFGKGSALSAQKVGAGASSSASRICRPGLRGEEQRR